MQDDIDHVTHLHNKFIKGIEKKLTHITINGDKDKRYPGNINVSFSCVEGESLIMAINKMAVSSGSACTSASLEPSYVLRAIGVDEANAHTSIRIGFGRFTTEEEVDYAIELITREVLRLREMSPLWEMIQEGVDIKSIQWSQH
jgi:cysteine desulfurase